MTMMKAVNTLRIKKGRTEEVITRFKTAKSVHTFAGFILMEVLKKENTEEHDELQICTTWQDHSYFDAWRESRASEKAHAAKEIDKQESGDNPILGSELSTFEVCIQHHPAR
ncbi:antibiotic biosynthesis monooxygenase [Virgibacillus halodenitrificans]|uniref:antibiotic biosynthesis monooxygenase n=1 Tax=Virgibacillus halodenitrificans TaxID=1482 RepID=UPI002DBDBDEC|nr:antibiotic biosynthesis monooxygenase [Virgibacillus halodenitrificans]MEC2160137.1 antibiotic biosynthesis monooxygenase [Virgibacillus halodenitrificans]